MGAASSVKVEKEENSKNLPRRRTGRRGSAIDPEAMKDEVLVNEAAQLAVFSKMRKEYEVLMENEVPYKAIFESLKRMCLQQFYPDVVPNVRTRRGSVIKQEEYNRRGSDRRASHEKKKRGNIYSKGLDVEHRATIDHVADGKSAECIDLLKDALRTLLFEENGNEELDMVISVMTKLEVKPKQMVITQGDTGDQFYVVEHGTLNFVVNGNVVGSVHGGGHFGELALIYDAPRAASVQATTSSILWMLGRNDFRAIQAQTSSDSLVRRSKWLQQVKILERLSARQLSLLAGALDAVRFKKDEVIIHYGDSGDCFYIVEEGSVECRLKDSREGVGESTVILKEGDYFGEMALLNELPRNADIIALESVKCLRLGRQEFTSMLGPLASLLERKSNKRILQTFDQFATLTDDELDSLLTQFDPAEFENKKVIFECTEPAKAFYIIVDGAVLLTEHKQDGTKHTVELKTSDHFGSEAFREEKYTSTVIAKGKTRCVKLTKGGIQTALNGANAEQQSLMDAEATAKNELSLINFKELVHIGILGEGSFGKVSMVQAFVNAKEHLLALKALSKAHIIECHQETHVLHEKQILQAVAPHPFIVQLYATHQNQNYLYMLMELVQGGELFSLLHDDEDIALDNDGICFYAANIYLALEHLHRRDVAYRDLKPENLLIDTTGYLKMVDFGFAKTIPFTTTNAQGRNEIHSRSYTLCGTQEYLAPEFVLNTGHDLGVDYWAFGILMYEMLLGYTPFETEDGDISKLFKNIAFVRTGANKVEFPSQLEESQPWACDFISKLLQGDPSKRMGAGINGSHEVRSHIYFKDIDFAKLEKLELTPPHIPHLTGRYDVSLFEGDQGLRANDQAFDDTNCQAFIDF